MPIIKNLKGAYSVADLEAMPFSELLEIWEAIAFSGTQQWLESQPKTFEPQRK